MHPKDILSLCAFRYNILNLEWSKEFVVNMKLTVCQDSETCPIDFAIFTDYHLPNIACDGTVFKGS